jgi:DNA polymerase-3 subunit alpha
LTIDKEELNEYFKWKCWNGLKEKGFDKKQEYIDRLTFELKIILQFDFQEYFLIVADFINWAKNNDILVGQGRGSAAGSLAAYCLKITNIDPIVYGLYFERFINPGRGGGTLPDIDVDFMEEGRVKVIDYVINKYGKDKVAHIGTFGSMKAKAAIRAAARTLGTPELGDPIAKQMLGTIHGKTQSIRSSIEQLPEIAKLYKKNNEETAVIKWALKIENLLQSVGVHASGLLLSKELLTDTCPLFKGKKDEITTQYEMKNIEEVGLVKFDFLGLRTLSKIHTTLKLIKQYLDISIDIDNIDLKDDKVYAELRAGNNLAIFQMENGGGLRDLLVKVRPTVIDDIIAVVSIFRPGPLQSDYMPKYLAARAGEQEPEYLVPELEPILENTSGFMIYQEQVLRIAKELCGFSLTEADLLRRAIGKKKTEEMKKYEKQFKEGWVKNKLSLDKANILWNQIISFSDYAFNRCLSRDTLIKDCQNNFMSIQEIKNRIENKEQVFLKSFEIDTKNMFNDECLEVINSGEQELYEFILENGFKIKATLNHKFLCIDYKYHTLKDIFENQLDIFVA